MDRLLRNLRPMGGAAVDILLRDGRIAGIGPGLQPDRGAGHGGPPPEVEDCGGAIALPGLIDAHTHLDKSLLGMDWAPNTTGAGLAAIIDNERGARTRLGIDPHRQSMRHALALVGAGTTHIRSHVDIDTEHGLTVLDGVLETRAALKGVVDIEIVAFPQSGLMLRPGTAELMDRALAAGADLVGGLDPCGIDRDPKGHLDTIFGLAERHGKPIDIHLHEQGELGAFSMELILERTRALGMKGKVAISHAFCLGMPDWPRTEALLAALADLDVAILTTGSPSAPVPAVRRVLGAGLRMGAGCDGVRDCWSPWSRPDMLDRLRIVALKNNLRMDTELAEVLTLATTSAAAVLGLGDYGLAPGCAADLTLLAGETLGQALADGAPRLLTLKRGQVVARGGAALRPAP